MQEKNAFFLKKIARKHYFCGDNKKTNSKLNQYEEVSITLCGCAFNG